MQNRFEFYLPDEPRLLEVEFELLGRVEIVKDDEAARGLVVGNVTEVDALSRESCHGTVIVQMGTADG